MCSGGEVCVMRGEGVSVCVCSEGKGVCVCVCACVRSGGEVFVFWGERVF